jgi:hypothetical protein
MKFYGREKQQNGVGKNLGDHLRIWKKLKIKQ